MGGCNGVAFWALFLQKVLCLVGGGRKECAYLGVQIAGRELT